MVAVLLAGFAAGQMLSPYEDFHGSRHSSLMQQEESCADAVGKLWHHHQQDNAWWQDPHWKESFSGLTTECAALVRAYPASPYVTTVIQP